MAREKAAAHTRTTGAGYPQLGTTIEVLMLDGSWLRCRVVGNTVRRGGGWGHIGLEALTGEQSGRRALLPYDDVEWRRV